MRVSVVFEGRVYICLCSYYNCFVLVNINLTRLSICHFLVDNFYFYFLQIYNQILWFNKFNKNFFTSFSNSHLRHYFFFSFYHSRKLCNFMYKKNLIRFYRVVFSTVWVFFSYKKILSTNRITIIYIHPIMTLIF